MTTNSDNSNNNIEISNDNDNDQDYIDINYENLQQQQQEEVDIVENLENHNVPTLTPDCHEQVQQVQIQQEQQQEQIHQKTSSSTNTAVDETLETNNNTHINNNDDESVVVDDTVLSTSIHSNSIISSLNLTIQDQPLMKEDEQQQQQLDSTNNSTSTEIVPVPMSTEQKNITNDTTSTDLPSSLAHVDAVVDESNTTIISNTKISTTIDENNNDLIVDDVVQVQQHQVVAVTPNMNENNSSNNNNDVDAVAVDIDSLSLPDDHVIATMTIPPADISNSCIQDNTIAREANNDTFSSTNQQVLLLQEQEHDTTTISSPTDVLSTSSESEPNSSLNLPSLYVGTLTTASDDKQRQQAPEGIDDTTRVVLTQPTNTLDISVPFSSQILPPILQVPCMTTNTTEVVPLPSSIEQNDKISRTEVMVPPALDNTNMESNIVFPSSLVDVDPVVTTTMNNIVNTDISRHGNDDTVSNTKVINDYNSTFLIVDQQQTQVTTATPELPLATTVEIAPSTPLSSLLLPVLEPESSPNTNNTSLTTIETATTTAAVNDAQLKRREDIDMDSTVLQGNGQTDQISLSQQSTPRIAASILIPETGLNIFMPLPLHASAPETVRKTGIQLDDKVNILDPSPLQVSPPIIITVEQKDAINVPSPTPVPAVVSMPIKQVKVSTSNRCPLLCCFYAEFDIIVGPKIINECPAGFMEQDMNSSMTQIEAIVQRTLQDLVAKQNNNDSTPTTLNTYSDIAVTSENKQQQQKIENINSKLKATLSPNTTTHKSNTFRSSLPLPPSQKQQENPSIPSSLPRQHQNHHRKTLSGSDASLMNVTDGSTVVESTTLTNTTSPPMKNTERNPLVVSTGSPVVRRHRHRRTISGASTESILSSIASDIDSKEKNTELSSIGNNAQLSSKPPQQLTKNHSHKHLKGVTSPGRNAGKTSTDPGANSVTTNAQSNSAGTSSTSPVQTIFDSCSEYIITGNELSENIVNLSTHNIHVLTRPTTIYDDVRYERNCLSYCIGFIIRRSADPYPYRAIISKVTSLLCDMEVESHFLSKSKAMTKIATDKIQQQQSNVQTILEQMFLTLNSTNGECNMIMNGNGIFSCSTSATQSVLPPPPPPSINSTNKDLNTNNGKMMTTKASTNNGRKSHHDRLLIGDNILNIKLFHPPRPLVEPVKDYSVPILLRRDWQIQAYDWDLSINWVSMHIDGILNAKQISQKAEVDMELLRACLRVLKHHCVIALVDMFYFTNRYECTKDAAALLLPSKISSDSTSTVLLEEAVRYSFRKNDASRRSNESGYNNVEVSEQKQKKQQQIQLQHEYNDSLINPSTSPIRSLTILHNAGIANHHRPVYGSPLTPPTSMYERVRNNESSTGIGGRFSGNSNSCLGQQHQHQHQQQTHGSFRTNNSEMLDYAKQRKDYNEIKQAIAELYCSCHRGKSIGDLLLDRVTSSKGKEKGTTSNNNIDNGNNIDWAKIYPLIDFRRFTSFGILYGLLKRVHCYPLYVSDDDNDGTIPEPLDVVDPDVTFMSTSSIGAIGSSRMSHLLNRANSLGPNQTIGNPTSATTPASSSTMSVSRLFSLRAAHYRNTTTSTRTSTGNNRGVSVGTGLGGENDLVGFLPLIKNSTTSFFQQREEAKEERHALIARVRQRMDGIHCDDELVCAFQLPLLELFDLVCDTTGTGKNRTKKSIGGNNNKDDRNTNSTTKNTTMTKRIVSVYATES